MKGLRHIDTELARVGIDTYLFHFHQVKELMFTKEQQSSEERFETLVDFLDAKSEKVHRREVLQHLHCTKEQLDNLLERNSLKDDSIKVWKEGKQRFMGLESQYKDKEDE